MRKGHEENSKAGTRYKSMIYLATPVDVQPFQMATIYFAPPKTIQTLYLAIPHSHIPTSSNPTSSIPHIPNS